MRHPRDDLWRLGALCFAALLGWGLTEGRAEIIQTFQHGNSLAAQPNREISNPTLPVETSLRSGEFAGQEQATSSPAAGGSGFSGPNLGFSPNVSSPAPGTGVAGSFLTGPAAGHPPQDVGNPDKSPFNTGTFPFGPFDAPPGNGGGDSPNSPPHANGGPPPSGGGPGGSGPGGSGPGGGGGAHHMPEPPSFVLLLIALPVLGAFFLARRKYRIFSYPA